MSNYTNDFIYILNFVFPLMLNFYIIFKLNIKIKF